MEYHSVHSAPDSRMKRMEAMRFTRNRQNTRSFGKFLAGNPTRPPCSLTLKCVRRYSSSQITSDSVSRSEPCRSVLFEIEIPYILLFLNRNKNSQNSPKRMHPQGKRTHNCYIDENGLGRDSEKCHTLSRPNLFSS